MSTTIYVLSRNMRKYQNFLSDIFHFWVVKFSVYLNRHVFVMIPAVRRAIDCAIKPGPGMKDLLLKQKGTALFADPVSYRSE